MTNKKIVKQLSQQILLAGCTDQWGYCSWAMNNGGCHGPHLVYVGGVVGYEYTYEYAPYMKTSCQGSCPEFCRKLLPPCILRESSRFQGL